MFLASLLARQDAANAVVAGVCTAMAIGADPRIKAACVTGWMCTFAHLLPRHLRHTWMVFTPGLRRALDLPDVAALHAPGALLVQQCRRDQLFPLEGMEAAVEKLGRAYAKAGVPDEVISRVNAALQEVLAEPGLAQQLAVQGLEIRKIAPEALKSFMAAEVENWGNIIRRLNLQPS